MQQGYYARAWNDIKNSPGWFGKLCLLAVLDFIPVFGPIVAYGYLGGWARDIAWGVKSPLPAHIFANEDGKLYRRGWFVFAALFIYSAIAWALSSLLMGLAGAAAGGAAGAYANGRMMSGATAGFDALGFVMGVLAFAVTIAVVFFALAGSARSVIYDRFSPAFQIPVLWKMIKRDASGIVRILLMALLVGLIIGIVVFCAIFVVICLSIFVGIATGGPAFMNMISSSYDDLTYGYGYGYGYGAGDAAFLAFLQSILPALGMGALLFMVVCYFAVVGQMFIVALVFRAMGYWTQDFEVAKWGGPYDPLPFEIEQAQAQAAAQAAWQAQQQATAAQQPAWQPPAAQAQEPATAAPAAEGASAQQPATAAPAPAAAPVEPGAQQSAPQAPTSSAAPAAPAAPVAQPAPAAPQAPSAAVAQAPATSAAEPPAALAPEAPAQAPAASPATSAASPAPSPAEAAKPASDDGSSK